MKVNKYVLKICLKIKSTFYLKNKRKMPNLKIEQERFDELMGKKYTFEQLDELGFEFGIEV